MDRFYGFVRLNTGGTTNQHTNDLVFFVLMNTRLLVKKGQ